jgi:peptidyl-tRNA hydrolase
LYIVTRRDLTPGQQIAQVAHAIATFARKSEESFKVWHDLSSYIVILSVKDLEELHSLRTKLLSNQVSISEFYEPDINNELTAFTVSPINYEIASKLLSSYPLAFQESRTKDVIIVHYNKKHNEDITVPQWVVKHKGETHYVRHIEFKNVCFSTKETSDNPHTKGSLKFKGKLTIDKEIAYITQ